METHGIDHLKKLLAFVLKSVDTALNLDKNGDGQLSLSENFSAITTLSFQFPQLVESFPFLKKEFRDLDPSEIDALRHFVNTELDLPMKYDKIEEATKLTINMLHYNYNYMKKMKKVFQPIIVIAEP